MELKPCPFCGSEPVRKIVMDVLSVACPACVSIGFYNHSRLGNLADIEWNSRLCAEQAHTALIERLEALFDNYGPITGGQMRVDLQQIIDEAR